MLLFLNQIIVGVQQPVLIERMIQNMESIVKSGMKFALLSWAVGVIAAVIISEIQKHKSEMKFVMVEQIRVVVMVHHQAVIVQWMH